MKNAISSLISSVVCGLGIFLGVNSPLLGGFALDFQDSSLRQLGGGVVEIDGFLSTTLTAPQATSLTRIRLSFILEPTNVGDSISGITFLSVRNPNGNGILFDNLDTSDSQVLAPDFLIGSLSNATPIPAPAAATKAFTVSLFSNNPNTTNVNIVFGVSEYDANRGNEVINNLPLEFLRPSSGPISITGVPEPSTYILSAIGLGAVVLSRKRFRKR